MTVPRMARHVRIGGDEAGELLAPDSVDGARELGSRFPEAGLQPASLESGHPVETLEPSGPTLAEGLEGGISRGAFARVVALVAGVSVVTEREIASAVNLLWQSLGLRVEGSAAAALVPIVSESASLGFEGDLVVVLTGRNVDEKAFRRVADSASPC